MINKLINLANALDNSGLKDEASKVDVLIKKAILPVAVPLSAVLTAEAASWAFSAGISVYVLKHLYEFIYSESPAEEVTINDLEKALDEYKRKPPNHNLGRPMMADYDNVEELFDSSKGVRIEYYSKEDTYEEDELDNSNLFICFATQSIYVKEVTDFFSQQTSLEDDIGAFEYHFFAISEEDDAFEFISALKLLTSSAIDGFMKTIGDFYLGSLESDIHPTRYRASEDHRVCPEIFKKTYNSDSSPEYVLYHLSNGEKFKEIGVSEWYDEYQKYIPGADVVKRAKRYYYSTRPFREEGSCHFGPPPGPGRWTEPFRMTGSKK